MSRGIFVYAPGILQKTGNSDIINVKFSHLLFPRQQELQIYMKDVEVYYSYLFSRDKSKAVQQVSLDNSSESKVFKNQNSFHYTAPVGWMNDPVGLCFYKGLYHMFYQFNPASQKWGDAHWDM